MSETVYTRGKPGEMPEILDFINFVFSQAHCPHDFKKLLPKVYGHDAPAGMEEIQYLARSNGKIIACAADLPQTLVFGEHKLLGGFVGNVSVHPYMRGQGHMKKIMTDLIADAEKQNMDLLVLGGQRQRYGYFGFENAGIQLRFRVEAANVRHVLAKVNCSAIEIREFYEGDVFWSQKVWLSKPVHSLRRTENYLSVLRSWQAFPLYIAKNGKQIGYLAGSELLLEDESLLPEVVKALMQRPGVDQMIFRAGPHEKERISFFRTLAQETTVAPVEMIRVLSWPNVLTALMEMRADKLEDGVRTLDIEGDGIFRITAQGGKVRVDTLTEAPADALKLSHLEAERAFFAIEDAYLNPVGLPLTWRQLPFYMSEQDGF